MNSLNSIVCCPVLIFFEWVGSGRQLSSWREDFLLLIVCFLFSGLLEWMVDGMEGRKVVPFSRPI